MKYNRPDSLPSITLKITLDVHVYITVSYDEHGICEVFSQGGKAKSKSDDKAKIEADLKAHAEAISRLISRALQQARSIEAREDILKTLAKTLRGIQGHAGGYNQEVFIHSVPDAIGWILQGCPNREGNLTLDTKKHPLIGEDDDN